MRTLRLALGIIMIWFGVLKFFEETSPAELLAAKTIGTLTFGLMQKEAALPLLAAVECLLGLGIILPSLTKYTVPVMCLHMAGAVSPLILFPSETWQHPFVPTLMGQYMIKNVVLVAAALLIYKTAQGAKLITDPKIAREAKSKQDAKRSG